MKHPSHIAISNTHVLKQTKDKEGVWWEFEETPLMSTYLFMFVVGKFEYLESKSK